MTDTQTPTPTEVTADRLPATAIRHPKCGGHWTGLGRSHCDSCCRTFSCDSAADKHRKGPYGGGRHCVDPATVGLVAREMPWGVMWQNPAPDAVASGLTIPWTRAADRDAL